MGKMTNKQTRKILGDYQNKIDRLVEMGELKSADIYQMNGKSKKGYDSSSVYACERKYRNAPYGWWARKD